MFFNVFYGTVSWCIGTPCPDYEKNNEQMRKISQARHTKIAGTPEHEKCKEKMRKRSQGATC